MYAVVSRVAVGAELDCQSVLLRPLTECSFIDVMRLQILAISVADVALIWFLLKNRHNASEYFHSWPLCVFRLPLQHLQTQDGENPFVKQSFRQTKYTVVPSEILVPRTCAHIRSCAFRAFAFHSGVLSILPFLEACSRFPLCVVHSKFSAELLWMSQSR